MIFADAGTPTPPATIEAWKALVGLVISGLVWPGIQQGVKLFKQIRGETRADREKAAARRDSLDKPMSEHLNRVVNDLVRQNNKLTAKYEELDAKFERYRESKHDEIDAINGRFIRMQMHVENLELKLRDRGESFKTFAEKEADWQRARADQSPAPKETT